VEKTHWKGWGVLGMVFLFLGHGMAGSSSVILLYFGGLSVKIASAITLTLGASTVFFGYYVLGNWTGEDS